MQRRNFRMPSRNNQPSRSGGNAPAPGPKRSTDPWAKKPRPEKPAGKKDVPTPPLTRTD